jgi:uncharacterized membrane protein YjgN (DUF898 family)
MSVIFIAISLAEDRGPHTATSGQQHPSGPVHGRAPGASGFPPDADNTNGKGSIELPGGIPAEEDTMAESCPKCGSGAVSDDRCQRCGIVVSLYMTAMEKMRRGPTRTASMPIVPHGGAPTPTPAAPDSQPSRTMRPVFQGSGSTLLGIHVVNVLLTLVTLGAYYFWAKVRVRRYVWSETEFEGDRFAYHGTGGELFRGFMKTMLVFVTPMAALSLVPLLPGGKGSSMIVGVFVPVAIIGARRYRLSRTSWRGIRFSLRADTWSFVKLFIHGTFLTSLTLSLYYPVFRARRQGFLIANSYFGQRRFGFDGRGNELVRPYVVALLLTLPTLGLCWFWYLARQQRYIWEHTRFETARFQSVVTGATLLELTLGNVALLLVTLGLGWPWVAARNARFALANLRIDGAIDFDSIVQEPAPAPATADVLSALIGADVDFA